MPCLFLPSLFICLPFTLSLLVALFGCLNLTVFFCLLRSLCRLLAVSSPLHELNLIKTVHFQCSKRQDNSFLFFCDANKCKMHKLSEVWSCLTAAVYNILLPVIMIYSLYMLSVMTKWGKKICSAASRPFLANVRFSYVSPLYAFYITSNAAFYCTSFTWLE